jgi:protein-arginine kinase activator protein McsA
MVDDNILNNNNFDDYIDQLAELVMAKIVEKYGKVYPLRFSDNQEEILIGELARLTTTLALLEDRQEYEKCSIIKNRIRNIENKLKNL